MRKYLIIILVLMCGFVKAQTPPRTGFAPWTAKWKFVNPVWLDSGAYITKIVKTSGQNRYLVYDSLTGKIGYRYVSTDLSGYVPYTGATTNVNIGTNTYIGHSLKSDASDGVLIEAANGTDVGIFGAGNTANSSLYGGLTVGSLTSGNGTDSVVVASSAGLLKKRPASAFGSTYTAGNGIIVSGSTIYADTTKIASRRTPIFLTNITTPLIIGGTSTTSPLTYKTTTGVGTTGADHIFQVGNNGATEAMRILNSGNVGIGTNNPTVKLSILGSSTSGVSTPTKISGGTGSSSGGFYLGAYNADWGGFWSSSVTPASNNYALIARDTRTAINATSDITFYINDDGTIANLPFYLNSTGAGIGTNTPVCKLHIPIPPPSNPNFGLVSIGSGAWNGSTSGFFTGSSSGTLIAGNLASGSTADLLNLQIAGVSKIRLYNSGRLTATTLYSNSYTPTLTGVTNVSASQSYTCQYSRVDSVVTVSGTIGITATSNNARTTIGISLPVASNFTAISNAGGAAYTTANTTAGHGAGIYADATNDRVELDYYETHGTADIFTFSFTYRIK